MPAHLSIKSVPERKLIKVDPSKKRVNTELVGVKSLYDAVKLNHKDIKCINFTRQRKRDHLSVESRAF